MGKKSKIAAWILSVGLLLTGLGGGFAPWVYKEGVALQLTALGLAEFVKFLPEVRLGQVQVQRLYFLLPLFVASLALPLIAINRQLMLPGWWRVLLRLAVVPLALASLSPVWTPTVLVSVEFRLQTVLAAGAMALLVISPLLKKLPVKLLAVLFCISGVVTIALPLWQFGLVRAGIEEAYHEPILLGWGWWLMLVGIIMGMAGGIGAAFIWVSNPPGR